MIHDKADNPRIRTKIKNIDDALDEGFFAIVDELRNGTVDINEYQSRTLNYFREHIKSGLMENYANKTGPEEQSAWMLKRHIDHRRYSVLCYRVEHGEVHPPHHHHNVASTQILLRGNLHLREYNRLGRKSDGTLLLELASDQILHPGDHFQASEWNRNVHWFSAINGPAVIFNTNARGFEDETFETDEDRYGRLYVDPTNGEDSGLIEAEEFDEAEAQRRFQSKPLSDFSIPSIP